MKRFASSRQRTAGQSLVEYLIILPSLLLLTLGAVQFGLLYQIKSQLNYAAFNAARQGSLKNGNSTAMKDALAAGMSPLFTPKPDVTSMLRGRVVGAIEAFNPLVTTITRVNPTSAAMEDFGVADPLDANKKILPNDNLQYRDATVIGSKSGLNIQDANILKIRVTYCAKLVVPIANTVFYSLVTGVEGLTNLGGLFQPGSMSTLPKDLSCAQLKDKYAGKVANAAAGIDAVLGQGTGEKFETEVLGVLTDIDTLLKEPVPLLNWAVGGYRIPITAEAVVRMQSPLR